MTDLAPAAERLRIQEEALRFAQVGLYRYRFDGTVLDMNEAAFEILGLRGHFASPADVIGRKIEDLIIYTGPRGRLRRLIRTRGEARNVLYPFRTLDGVDKWVVHDSFPILDPSTGEQIIQAIIKDVTKARQREETLRRSQEQLTRILETIAEGIVIFAPDGRFTFANASAERILGLSRDALRRQTYHDKRWRFTTVDGRSIRAEDLPFAQVMRTGRPVHDAQLALQRPDGTRVSLSLNAAPLPDAAGIVVGVVASLIDITGRLQLERVREEFLSSAAHELKTPVATIKGYARLLQQWAPGGHEPREGAAFEVINRQSDRLGRLVQGLLEFARLQQGRFELYRKRFDLGDLAAEVVERMQAATPTHSLQLQRKEPVPVEADRERIDEVLVNLLDNAIKASPSGGPIHTRVYRKEGQAIVSVTDWGVGIPSEKQPRIFERFYQAHAGPPYHRSGMGMGLYLNREIVARHGGSMWFESELGRGSTFYFSLPLVEGSASGRRA